MGRALGIIYRAIATHISKKAGHTKPTAHTGAVTLIQRFGSAINLNVHFHMLFLDAESRCLISNVVADENDPMHQLHGASVTYRIALGATTGSQGIYPANDTRK